MRGVVFDHTAKVTRSPMAIMRSTLLSAALIAGIAAALIFWERHRNA